MSPHAEELLRTIEREFLRREADIEFGGHKGELVERLWEMAVCRAARTYIKAELGLGKPSW